MERENSTEYSVVFLVEGEKFKLRNQFAFEDFISVVGSAANSVGTSLEFAAFASGPDATHSRASAFWLYLSTTMVFAAVRTHFPRKNTSSLCQLASCHGKKK